MVAKINLFIKSFLFCHCELKVKQSILYHFTLRLLPRLAPRNDESSIPEYPVPPRLISGNIFQNHFIIRIEMLQFIDDF